MHLVRKIGCPAPRAPRGGGRRFALVTLCCAGLFVGCATTPTPAKLEETQTMARLRAENIAQTRKLEELENQVFILNAALESRRGEEVPSAPSLPPVLPEVKLTRGERLPPPSDGRADSPASLVDETEVEYTGAAAERGSGKRPVLRLWGPGEGSGTDGNGYPETTAADAGRSGSAIRRGGSRGSVPQPKAVRRAPVSPPTPSAAAAILSDAAEMPSEEAGGKGENDGPKQQSEKVALINRPLRAPAAKAAPVAPARATPPAPVPARPVAKPTRTGIDLYNGALADLRQGRHDEAVAGLRAFVRGHAQHDLADNAQYWLGECFYDRKDYATAAREFQKVGAQFSNGNKVPDAQLKLGLSYLALGNARTGRAALTDVVRRFPHHPAAALAEAKLAAIGSSDASAALVPRPGSKEVR